MKKLFFALMALAVSLSVMAQSNMSEEELQKSWRQFKHQRDISHQVNEAFPIGEAAPAAKSVKALPEDRVWFPGEWEEVQAIVVCPYYSYKPDTNLGAGTYLADPVVTGLAEYLKYSIRGWTSTDIYGPYKCVMDTSSSFGMTFFYLMDGIQKGGAEAWVRVESEADTAKVLRTLNRKHLRSDNVRFIIGAGNSFWYRDCGPICFYHGDEDSVAMLDFEYYPGRALDDSLPSLITRQMGIPNYINTIEWEGGNCLVDGAGFLFTSDAVYGNNADSRGQLTWDGRNTSSIHYVSKSRLSNAQTRQALHDLLGQRETHVLTAYQYDGGTGHVDLYADMCEENGFVFSVMPSVYSNWVDYRTGARNIDSLCSYTSIFDRPYYKSTIPFPSTDNGGTFPSQSDYDYNYTRTYSNHTFVNDLILQPCFSAVSDGQPTAAWDRANIEALKAAYPGYTIYPIDVREFDGSGGALHCVTKQIPADNPVRILHKSVVGNAVAMRGHDIPISAIITNRSGISHAECVYRVNDSTGQGNWDTVSLVANGNKFSGHIPTADLNDRILDTAYNPYTIIDSTLLSIDTVVVGYDTIITDTTQIIVPIEEYVYHYDYDTISGVDTVISLRPVMITYEYYISATSNNGKTITKPMTAHQGGYYSFFYDGTEEALDSVNYDFSTDPRPMNDITFVFDANRTYLDTNAAPHPFVAIDPVETEQSFGQFYPNPAHDHADIQINLGNGANCQVAIFDNLGRMVHSTTLQSAGTIRFTLRTDKLARGLYTVRFTQNGNIVTRRLVVE